MASIFTTSPPVRPPPPKQPLFTTKFFSTKSFGPGHLVGAGILMFGIVGISKLLIARGQEEADRARRLAQHPEDASKLAKAENGRGEYGARP